MAPESKNQMKQKAKNAAKHSKKANKMLKEYDNVTTIDSPSHCLFIGNGGMLCGIGRETLMKTFAVHGSISDLVMLPKKSFALLRYTSKESAQKAAESLDGFVITSKDTLQSVAPLYVRYINTDTLYFAKKYVEGGEVYPCEGASGKTVNGLSCLKEFIDETYERDLYGFFTELCQEQNDKENVLKHRNVRHFGYKFLYGSNNIDKEKPMKEGIPDICKPILEEIVNRGIMDGYPDQLTVNQYLPGQGIPPHIDTHSAFEDGILSLTLNSQVTMDFSSPEGETVPLLLPRRSLLGMKGESRFLWSHGITPRKFDIVYTDEKDGDSRLTLRERGTRISLTFRKILRQPCRCIYPTKCDSQNISEKVKEAWEVPSTENEASKLEDELVTKVYENIAEHFSDTRHSPWPKVKKFLCNLPAHSMVADVGCGNGKYLGVNKRIMMLGSDRSVNLISICQERGHQALVSDCLQLPYRSNCFDGAICIAVIHHLSTEQRRLDAIKELIRITRLGGRVLIYVWALEQDMKEEDAKPNEIHETENELEREVDKINTGTEELDLDGDSTKGIHCYTSKEVANESERHLTDESESAETSKKYIQLQEGRNKFQQQDLLVPWRLKNNAKTLKEEQVFHRFYHVFKQGELQELCERLSNVKIVDLYLDCGNWCIILQKVDDSQ